MSAFETWFYATEISFQGEKMSRCDKYVMMFGTLNTSQVTSLAYAAYEAGAGNGFKEGKK